MTDDVPPDDPETNPVKKAMSRRRRVAAEDRPGKPGFTVIDGGKGEENDEGFSLYGEASMPPAGDPEDPGPGSGSNDDGDSNPPLGEDDLDGARHCAKYDQNDRDNGRRLIYWFGLDLAYVPGMGWLVFRLTHWLRDDGELEVALRAQAIVDRIKWEATVIEHTPGVARQLAVAEAAKRKKAEDLSAAEAKLLRWAESAEKILSERKSKRRAFAVTSGNRGRTVAMIAQAASMRAVEPTLLDADHLRFNLRSGTLRFWRELDPDQPEGGERMAGHVEHLSHVRADMITKVAEVNYHPEAACPDWLAFLERVQPDPVMRLWLQVSHAYSLLIGGNDEQVVLFHYGQGANGKSVFIETLGRLAGLYRAVVAPETFTGDQQKQGQQANPDIARLHNTRLVTVEELPRGINLRENTIKAASGGTKLVARFLQKEFFEFDPIFTAIMSGNDMPEVSGTDYGIWRRLKIVPWKVTIPVEERVPFGTMLKRFDAERAGILNWLIEGLLLYLANGLEPYLPTEVKAFTEDYREDRDPVGQFVESCVIAAPDWKVNASDMFKAYTRWCEANAVKPYQQTAFGRRLNALGIKKEKGRTYTYLDVKLGEIPDIADPRDLPPARTKGDAGWEPVG